jgi:glutathionyl-hydroquinone reductase
MFRHDPVYYNRFKLNKAFLWQYPHVWRWMASMLRDVPGVAEAATKSILQHCKQVSLYSGSNYIILLYALYF